MNIYRTSKTLLYTTWIYGIDIYLSYEIVVYLGLSYTELWIHSISGTLLYTTMNIQYIDIYLNYENTVYLDFFTHNYEYTVYLGLFYTYSSLAL